jgi:hypothetical protein
MFEHFLREISECKNLGAVTGLGKVVGYTLVAKGVSQQIADRINQIISYGGFFILRFNHYLQQTENQVDVVNGYMQAVFQAVLDTGQWLVFRVGINMTSHLLSQMGNNLVDSGWKHSGNILNRSSSALSRFGMFSWNVWNSGLANTAAYAVGGAIMDTAVEELGTSVVDLVLKK